MPPPVVRQSLAQSVCLNPVSLITADERFRLGLGLGLGLRLGFDDL